MSKGTSTVRTYTGIPLNDKIELQERVVRGRKEWADDWEKMNCARESSWWRQQWRKEWDTLYELYRERFFSETGGYHDRVQRSS